jgi:hypothetical protein
MALGAMAAPEGMPGWRVTEAMGVRAMPALQMAGQAAMAATRALPESGAWEVLEQAPQRAEAPVQTAQLQTVRWGTAVMEVRVSMP